MISCPVDAEASLGFRMQDELLVRRGRGPDKGVRGVGGEVGEMCDNIRGASGEVGAYVTTQDPNLTVAPSPSGWRSSGWPYFLTHIRWRHHVSAPGSRG